MNDGGGPVSEAATQTPPEVTGQDGSADDGAGGANRDTDGAVAHPYLFAQPIYLAAGWRGVLPLPSRSKEPPPRDYTGRDKITKELHPFPTDDDLLAWAEDRGHGNVALRLPPDVLGIDVDAYDGKPGAESLTALEAQHGLLPGTWTSTSRDDGVSGIRLYRATLPEGRRWKEKNAGPGIELLHVGHRYAIVWPSIHPSGRLYRWIDPYGSLLVDTVPYLAELPELPPAWIEALSAPTGRTAPKAPKPAQSKDKIEDKIKGRFTLPKKHVYTRADADAWIEEYALAPLRDAPNGSRNNQLNDAAMVLGHFVPQLMTEAEATEKLEEIAQGIGLDDDEITATVTSGLAAGMAEPYDLIEEPAKAEEPAPRTSRRVNLRPYLDGTYSPPTPSVGGQRSDGVKLLYPARWHTVIALTAAGKSWFAIWHAYVELLAGNVVVYFHFEETSPALTIGRLRALGVPDDVIAERFIWLDCSAHWTVKDLQAEFEDLDPTPTLAILDGINAACSTHGWPVNEPLAVGRYRELFVYPFTTVNAAVLSLGHPPKALDRQTERHGFGSTAWLDEVDGVGMRLVATRKPIRRGHRGASGLYTVKDRDDQVQQHGRPVENRDGWSYMGEFVLDNSTTTIDPATRQLAKPTNIELVAPTRDTAEGQDQLAVLANAITAWLEKHGGRFETKADLKDGLRAAKVTYDDGDIGPALLWLVDEGRLEWPIKKRGTARPGWLTTNLGEVAQPGTDK